MGLSVLKIDAAKPAAKVYKLFDEKGLFLLVTPNGSKLWRFKYRFDGKEKLLSLGCYEDVSLADAREKRDDLRKLVRRKTDPSEQRKSAKTASPSALSGVTLNSAAASWLLFHRENKPTGSDELFSQITPKMLETLEKLGDGMQWSDSYATQVEKRLDRHILQHIGREALDDIDSNRIARILTPLAPDIQHRIKRDLVRLFSFTRIMGWRTLPENPAADMQEVLKKRPKRKNFAAITAPDEFAGLLRACDSYRGSFVVRTLLRLAPFVFQRPSELRLARWNEFNLPSAKWTIPAKRMKSREPHDVPLSRQAISILEELKPFSMNSRDSLLFPGERNRGVDERSICDATVTAALANMGFKGKQTAHGLRASARTILAEKLDIDERYIERQIDHLTKAPNGKAYDRTAFMPQRIEMMQIWADYLDIIKDNKIGSTNLKRLLSNLINRCKAL